MSNKDFEGIMEGLGDALAIAEGRADPATFKVHIPDTVDVRGIRKRRGMTQAVFAAYYGFTLGRLRDWEQGVTAPEAPLRLLLTAIDKVPDAINQAMASNDNLLPEHQAEMA